MNIQFQYPQALWALALVPLLFLVYGFYLYWKRRVTQRVGNKALVAELTRNHAPFKAHVKFFLLALAFALGCLALANPRRTDEGTVSVRKGIDVMLALDISNSMLAAEGGISRLEQAKSLMQALIEKTPNNRAGLVLFAGSAYVQMPLTYDQDVTQMFIQTANPSIIRAQGTAIGEALEKCEQSFSPESERFQTIVLLSDGETHDEKALEKAKDLAEKGIMINTVGIGSPEGATIFDPLSNSPKRDAAGNVVVSRLNEALLQQLAATTNGTYIHLTGTASAVNTLAGQFSQMEQKALGDSSQFTYATLYLWLAIPMLLLLAADVFVPDRKKVAP